MNHLKHSNDKSLQIFSVHANKPMAILADMRIIFCNRALMALTGYSADDIGQNNFLQKIMSDRNLERLFVNYGEAEDEGFTCKLLHIPVLLKNKSEIGCEINVSRIAWYGRNAMLLIFRNVSGSDSSDDERNQEYKIQTIGLLASGIVHDMNNILASIIGFIELEMESGFQGNMGRTNLQQAHEAAFRAKDLTQKILTLGQVQANKKSIIDIESVVEPLLKLLNASFPQHITIDYHRNNKPALITADPDDIFQLLLNLCINAHHAISGENGKIEIRLDEIHVQPIINVHGLSDSPTGYIIIEVSDNGHGIEKNLMTHIFDPCFTTKKQGMGTGIGLALVKHIVRCYEGFISLKSVPGKGSRFKIFLPMAAA
ncbi:MAG: hypothetical protein KJ737_06325 [Proteobacteria bacterium]|nr:hypothetical protein [Pseudomonadota bacterium]